jgi:hypothetical protein
MPGDYNIRSFASFRLSIDRCENLQYEYYGEMRWLFCLKLLKVFVI